MPSQKERSSPALKSGKRKGSPAKDASRSGTRKKNREPLYSAAVVALMAALFLMGRYALERCGEYTRYLAMRDAVDRAGFYEGIVIDGVDVSGMTLEQAEACLEEKDRRRRDSLRVTLQCGDRAWTLTPEELDYVSDYRSVARQAYQMGRSGSLEERYRAVNGTRRLKMAYGVSYSWDRSLLRAGVEAVAEELTVPPAKASVDSFDADTRAFTFRSGEDGWRVDTDRLYREAEAAADAGTGASTVTVRREKVPAGADVQELMLTYGQVSSALTNASSSSANRITNIRLALSMINGVRVDPGETFSFNNTVGQRTVERGFRMAGAFENGVSTEAVGGGICQVSTTLFNAAVKADLTVVERSPHSRPVAYVDKGKDAAVDWPGTDLKFRNDGTEPVYIAAYLSSDKRVHVEIYGKKLADGMYIRVEAVTTETISPGADRISYTAGLRRGESRVLSRARYGYRAEAYKIYYTASGSEIRRELLCRSSYASAPAVVETGR